MKDRVYCQFRFLCYKDTVQESLAKNRLCQPLLQVHVCHLKMCPMLKLCPVAEQVPLAEPKSHCWTPKICAVHPPESGLWVCVSLEIRVLTIKAEKKQEELDGLRTEGKARSLLPACSYNG